MDNQTDNIEKMAEDLKLDEETVNKIEELDNEEKKEEKSEVEKLLDSFKEYHKANPVKLVIGINSNDLNTSFFFTQSLIILSNSLVRHGVEYDILISTTDMNKNVIQSKNTLINNFITNTKGTHLLLVNSKISFSWLDVVKMIMNDKNIVGGCHPMANINWDKVKNNVVAKNDIQNEYLVAKSLDYYLNPMLEENGNFKLVDGNLIEVNDMFLEFSLIKRNVFDKMIEKGKKSKRMFELKYDDENETYINEDLTFSKYWKSLGYKLWMNVDVNLNHATNVNLKGSILLNIQGN